MSPQAIHERLKQFEEAGLINACEIENVLWVTDSSFPFAEAAKSAESLHVHVKVDDTAQLPRQQFIDWGAQVENEKEGFVKFVYPEGVNMIFSSIPVSQEELAEEACSRRRRPFLDHVGIDIRQENDETKSVFERIPCDAQSRNWQVASQGGDDQPVYCCHVEVGRKHWVYPAEDAKHRAPLEFALGPLKVNAEASGCDLRPANPYTHPDAANQTPCCGG